MLNKENTTYVTFIGLFMLIVSIICFIFPQIFDADFATAEAEDQIDLRIRYSALPLGIGAFLLFYGKPPQQHNSLIFVKGLLLIDLGYLSTRFTSMLIHGFDVSIHQKWLLIELSIAIGLAIIIKLKKASPRA